ncbi:MAG: hypothetical protein AB1489_33825 [Acidobacteriota bacterium]
MNKNSFKVILTIFVMIFFGYVSPSSARDFNRDQNIRELLAEMRNPLSDDDKLAILFKIGEDNIHKLIQALYDPQPEVSLNAQVIIRYLGNETGMKALISWYSEQSQYSVSGPIPLPLTDWDYKNIERNYLSKPAPWGNFVESYIYALALDDSPRSRTILDKIFSRVDEFAPFSTTRKVIDLTKANNPQRLIPDKKDIAKQVLTNAFFIQPYDQKYASARLIAFNGNKSKALVEIHINRGLLAEEWHHVVISKTGKVWKFFSISMIAVS